MKTITAAVLKSRVQSASPPILIDVRTTWEFRAGHVPGSVHIPLGRLASRSGEVADGQVVIICESGHRAYSAQAQLAGKGDSVVLEGGMGAWRAAGLPIERTPAPPIPLHRQVAAVFGLLASAGSLLALFAAPGWIGLSLFTSAALGVYGFTGWCLMRILLAKAPWNQSGRAVEESGARKVPVYRQVMAVASMIGAGGGVLALAVNPAWSWLCLFVGANLTIYGFTGFCLMKILLSRAPWNAKGEEPTAARPS